jgi:hypothetical protein
MSVLASSISIGLAVIALLFALAITWASFRAFRRTGSATHRHAFGGFVFLTIGILVEEVLLQFTTFPLHVIHSLESLLFVIGFGILYLSIR